MARTVGSVGVVLVHWNSSVTVTNECITSLKKGTVVPQFIVVVDNGSSENPAQEILSLHHDVLVFRRNQNDGFTGANNAGIRFLLDKEVDYVWVLNNDTVVHEECLQRFIDVLSRNPRVGICTGKTFLFDMPDVFWNAGSSWNQKTLTPRHIGSSEKDCGQYDVPREVSFADGCCMFIRAAALRGFELFDERYFAYNEDIDFCLRLSKKGWALVFSPFPIIWHRVSHSVSKVHGAKHTSPFQQYLGVRNRLFIIRRFSSSRSQAFVLTSSHIFRCLGIYAPIVMLKGEMRKSKAVLRAIVDGLTANLSSVSTVPGRPPDWTLPSPLKNGASTK
jgi:GT2 family glycosyltransferase